MVGWGVELEVGKGRLNLCWLVCINGCLVMIAWWGRGHDDVVVAAGKRGRGLVAAVCAVQLPMLLLVWGQRKPVAWAGTTTTMKLLLLLLALLLLLLLLLALLLLLLLSQGHAPHNNVLFHLMDEMASWAVCANVNTDGV